MMAALAVFAVGAISCGASHPTNYSDDKAIRNLDIHSAVIVDHIDHVRDHRVLALLPSWQLLGSCPSQHIIDRHRQRHHTDGARGRARRGLSALRACRAPFRSAPRFSGCGSPRGRRRSTSTVPSLSTGTPGAELDRVAQVVYTLTQFPAVTHVAFEISGIDSHYLRERRRIAHQAARSE